MSNDSVWTPVEDGRYDSIDKDDIYPLAIEHNGSVLTVNDTSYTDLNIHLPDNIRLCQRTPAPPGDVPDKIRELIEDDIAECYAITGNRDCPDCAEMRKWLESFHATPAPQPVAPRPDWSQERSIAEAEAIAAEFHHLSGTLQQILRNDIVDLLNKMKADYEAALVPPPVAPVPRWEDAPEGAMWAVIDGDMDNWVWCTQEPTLGFTRDMGWEWDFGEGWDHGNYAHTPIGTDWRTLKFRRPQAQPEPPHA